MTTETTTTEKVDVLVVGGGPVGLFLACRLLDLGLTCQVLECNGEPRRHSRSIGIHPPSLELFAELGLADALLERAVQVRRGHAYGTRHRLGSLDFGRCPGPFPFVLSLPQYETEAILEGDLQRRDPHALLRHAEVVAIDLDVADGVKIRLRQGVEERESELEGRFVVGCDGKESVARRAAGIAFEGGPYDDSFLMGDFADHTDLGDDAAIHLAEEGLVEAFPLPRGRRRWVATTDTYHRDASAADLDAIVHRRTGHRLPRESASGVGPFGIQRYLATTFVQGRLALAGDAAHVVSPIGGQGMNLGWLDAWDLADTLGRILHHGEPHEPALAAYARRRRRAAKKAIRRAELNMAIGRRWRLPRLRDTAIRWLLASPLATPMARLFTMRGL